MIVNMRTIIFRLKHGVDLKKSIEKLVHENDVKAGFIITCVGVVENVNVRMAGAKPDDQDMRKFNNDYEIISLTGTVSTNGTHLHLSFSDKNGNVIGGHLKEGTTVRMTAEIVLGVTDEIEMKREFDKETGFSELAII